MAEKLKDILSEARARKRVTLRDVERETGISNAYLSQLEGGSVTEPSPKKLYELAKYYGLSYASLMEAVGYVVPNASSSSDVMFIGDRLSATERAAVAAFLTDFRSHMPHKKNTRNK